MKKLLILCITGLLVLNINGCFNKTELGQSKTSDDDTEISSEIKDDDEDLLKDEYQNSSTKSDEEIQKEKYEKNPVSKKTIVIDPGHGNHSNLEKEKQSPDNDIWKIKDGGGAQGVVTDIPEYDVNMKVAVKLKNFLEQNNFNVIMTKITNEESPGNIERAEIGNKNNAALEIRIHCDSSDNQSVSGASMLVPEKVGYAVDISDISTNYGKIILDSLVNTCGMKNRGVVPRADMTGFNWSKVPVVLVEMGFMSNPNEDKLLSQDAYQEKLAQGLGNGIIEALK